MQSEIDIFNAALIEIGQTPLLGPVDDSKEAQLCNRRYPSCRDLTMRMHFWNCAMTRTELAQLAEAPGWGWERAYQLPQDYLRLHSVDTADMPWKIEGRTVVTNSDAVRILYVRRLVNVPEMDELLAYSIALKLGSSIAYAMTRQEKLTTLLHQKWVDSVYEARYIDSLEQKGDTLHPIEYTRVHGDGGLTFRGIAAP